MNSKLNVILNFHLENLKVLLSQINEIETNNNLSTNEKTIQLKKIKEELKEIAIDIDNIKIEIKLLRNYVLN